jgi:nitric oxide reductase NorQ protein
LVVSHNPGYQSALKDLKPSTKQRFGAIEFDYPARAQEVEILVHETTLAKDLAERLVSVAEAARRLKGHGLDEGISTRMLVHAGSLIRQGVGAEAACQMALVRPLSDDPDLILALNASVRACL